MESVAYVISRYGTMGVSPLLHVGGLDRYATWAVSRAGLTYQQGRWHIEHSEASNIGYSAIEGDKTHVRFYSKGIQCGTSAAHP